MIRPQTCPVCGKALAIDAGSKTGSFPFCSNRCQQIDFFRWCEGKYAIVEPLDEYSAETQPEPREGTL